MMMMMMMKTTKKIKEEEKEKPNPGGPEGGGVGSTSATPPPPSGPPDDRISELPVEILHRILGFLEMDEFLIGTSLVSTKWRNLWKSVSTLKFPHCFSGSGGGGITNNVEKYHNFVDNVLRLRDSQASKIQIFRYYCNDFHSREGGGGGGGGGNEDCLERLHNCIVSAAVNQGAQEIQISGSYLVQSGKMIHFNPSIFTSGGLLRKFTFDLLNSHYLIQFPRSMCSSATQLTHLSLDGIILPEGNDESNAAQLHLVCPVLEKLMICNCYNKHLKVLDISAPRLNSLSIDNVGMRDGHFDGLGECRLEIRTPNLTSLLYSGCVYVDCFTENLPPRIADATLDFTKERDMAEKTTSFATKLLKGLTTAKTLTLAGFEDILKDLLLLTPFTSLRNLWFFTSCNISSIHGMLHFLNSCNSVEKLVWEVVHMYEFVEVEGDEHLMLPQCRLTHLKHVHIKRLCGHKNAIEFVKFLLKSSVVLEDLIISTTKNSPKGLIEENLKQFIEEKTSFRSIKLQIL